jgi:uncharacterized protein
LPKTFLRAAPPIMAIICCALLFQILTTRPLPDISVLLDPSNMQTFKTLFISIVLEAFPFILLGVIISAALHLFVTEQLIRRIIPRNPVLGILFACVLGFLFPVCECGMIPVVRRLMRKGMPVYIAVVFILAGPVLNPVTFASTYMAFRTQHEMAYARMGLAFAAAAIVGLLLYRLARSNPLRHSIGSGQTASNSYHQGHEHSHHHGHDHGHTHGYIAHEHKPAHDHGGSNEHAHGNKLSALLGHASDEFFEMGKYLILGAGITALVQTFISRESLLAVGQDGLGSQLFMAGFAYVLSLCSTSDAFVASSFSPLFSTGSLLTFLVLGPMIDFKGTLMLLSVFKGRFVLRISLLTAAAVLAGSIMIEWLGWLG